MADNQKLIVGEQMRRVDDRYRITLPQELALAVADGQESYCVLAKERYGALSLWRLAAWQARVEPGISVVRQKVEGRWLPTQLAEVQQFARLLSTRSREVPVSARGRLVIPEEFREFLRVKPGGECVVLGAGICVELWHPETWWEYLKQEIQSFGPLFEKLSS